MGGVPASVKTQEPNIHAIRRGAWGSNMALSAAWEKRPAIEARDTRDSGARGARGDFCDDLDNSVLELGDLLVHEGLALRAQQAAATIFGATFVSMQRS
jgi:hypothetical protein